MVPWFAHYFGIREWEMDRLTHFGFLAYEHTAKQLMEGGDADG